MTIPELDPADLEVLHTRLVHGATAAGLLDVAYREIESPIGTLLLASTPRGLVRVAFAAEGIEEVLETLGQRLSPRILRAPTRLDRAATQLDEYFRGARTAFDLDLDDALSTGFRAHVQAHLIDIPYGATASYGQVSAALGKPDFQRTLALPRDGVSPTRCGAGAHPGQQVRATPAPKTQLERNHVISCR